MENDSLQMLLDVSCNQRNEQRFILQRIRKKAMNRNIFSVLEHCFNSSLVSILRPMIENFLSDFLQQLLKTKDNVIYGCYHP